MHYFYSVTAQVCLLYHIIFYWGCLIMLYLIIVFFMVVVLVGLVVSTCQVIG